MQETKMKVSKEDVFEIVKDSLIDLFEIQEDEIVVEAKLYDDLDIDSIDAVDLIVRLKEKTGKKPDVEIFKSVRSVGDVVDAVYNLVNT